MDTVSAYQMLKVHQSSRRAGSLGLNPQKPSARCQTRVLMSLLTGTESSCGQMALGATLHCSSRKGLVTQEKLGFWPLPPHHSLVCFSAPVYPVLKSYSLSYTKRMDKG